MYVRTDELVVARSRRRRARRAFTLVEILAVIVILGIASAIIIPQIGSRDDLRAAAAARMIVADLTYAQNLAISTGTPVYLRFDKSANKYSLLTNPRLSNSNFGDLLKNPVTQLDYVQQFGDVSPSRVDRWENVSIDTVAFNGSDSNYQGKYTVGFDELGTPWVWSYTLNGRSDLVDGSMLVIRAGAFTTTIKIGAATGEITVQ